MQYFVKYESEITQPIVKYFDLQPILLIFTNITHFNGEFNILKSTTT